MEKLKIIALMGKAHSGKDTVGKMLCESGGGVTMAFADKLKQICAEMFALQLEDFYSQEGKDKATPFPCLMCPTCHGVHVEPVVMEDSGPLAACKLCGSTGDRKVFASNWTHRTILQYVGTEGFRKIDPNVWVRYALERARQRLDGVPIMAVGVTPDAMEIAQAVVKRPLPQKTMDEASVYLKEAHYLANIVIAEINAKRAAEKAASFVVFTDCRFKSEAVAVWAAGGEVWRIKRPETDAEAQGLKGHASEVEQESIKDSECQAVIQNDGTLDNLRGLVVSQLHRFLVKY